MSNSLISIIINTAIGRETYLLNCLDHLKRQTDQDFEVLVIDCGSEGGSQRVEPFKQHLDLRYHWRPQDLCVSLSRNIGAELARGDFLILIDGDMLLNPHAVAAYRYYSGLKHTAIIGYYGNSPERVAPSQWYPELAVNYLDKRVHLYQNDSLQLFDYIYKYPYQFAWSANFGVSKQDYWSVGGFDERYQGWGSEDVQFGLDLASRGYHLHFAVDVWAEHQVHPRRTLFHDLELSGKDCPWHLRIPGAQELQLVDQQSQLPTVLNDLFGYYFVNDIHFGPESKTLLAYPDIQYVSDLKEFRIQSAPRSLLQS